MKISSKFFFILLIMIVYTTFFGLSNSSINLFVYYSYMSSFNGFKPGLTVYSKEITIKAFFSGEIVYHNNGYFYGNNFYKNYYIIKLDDETKIILTDIKIRTEDNFIKENETDFDIDNNLFDIFVIKNGNYENPLNYFKFKNFSKPYIANIYYVDDYGNLSYFREYYSKGNISIGIKAYILQFIERITKYNSISEINLYIDEKLFYSKKFLYQNYNDFINLKRLFYDDYTIIIPNIQVNNGKHKMKILISDWNNNIAIKEKSFTISGE
ncbi:MAG: hypothetical protein N3A58_04200 [Spirochaetes bacterium]|nr:hypothetical protein [Spirochaetota bacterium]